MNKPRIDQGPDYERGFVDGMQYQMQSRVDKAINRMAQPEQEPVIGTKTWLEDGKVVTQHLTAKDIYKDPEQPEQEPVAFLTNRRQRLNVEFNTTGLTLMPKSIDWKIPLYTTPPQRTWVGLTHQERNEIRGKYWLAMSDTVFDDIESKLKEKNT